MIFAVPPGCIDEKSLAVARASRELRVPFFGRILKWPTRETVNLLANAFSGSNPDPTTTFLGLRSLQGAES